MVEFHILLVNISAILKRLGRANLKSFGGLVCSKPRLGWGISFANYVHGSESISLHFLNSRASHTPGSSINKKLLI